ncbi:MAG: signal recognition particle subunit SRP19/SEC65 family protein [Thermoplasmata archaeon]|nr:signal recognition particle subunit SRP19/SEC65 family protein [Thermoplasmata archaeon]
MPDHFFVYPAYLGRKGTRALGRRVPASLAVGDATVERIVEAAVKLGFKAVAEPAKAYPRAPLGSPGRVRVTKRPGVPKTAFLRSLAEELRAMGPGPGPS